MSLINSLLFRQYRRAVIHLRWNSTTSDKRGLVLGVYSTENKGEIKLSKFAEKYDQSIDGKLLEQIKIAGPIGDGQSRIFWSLGTHPAVAVAGLGDASKWDVNDEINGIRENIRVAAAAGSKALLANKITEIDVEDMGDAQAAAEGSIIGCFKYQAFRNKEKQSPQANLKLATCNGKEAADDWKKGEILANAQNWARTLMDTPSNMLTPTMFANEVKDKLQPLGVEVVAHGRAWAEKKGMGSFLSVTNGSAQPPVFLEMTYTGITDNSPPVALVGKGITFDTGGISLKPSAKMEDMRADMGGAANIVAAIAALAELKAPLNIKGFAPLAENMPGGRATKPGDVVTAMNGKTIVVDNTDCEGRMVLCDALCYSAEFKPKFILDVATLTGAVFVALGDCVTGAYSTDGAKWEAIQKAGMESGDRLWRMPLFKHYASQMCDHDAYDLNNLGKGKGAGSCTAAAFLREFVPKDIPWLHLDMAGVMSSPSDQSYCNKGMSGRPVRTIIEFLLNEAKM